MSQESGSRSETPWKTIVVSALVGTAAFSGGLYLGHRGEQNHAVASSSGSDPAPNSVDGPVPPVITAPETQRSAPEEALAAAQEAAAAAQGAGAGVGPRHVFAESAMDPQEGHFKDRFGDCYGAYGKSPGDIASYIEARLGKRITGFDWFDDGIVVNFRSGERLPVWQKEIDCKDPPYDPLQGKTS